MEPQEPKEADSPQKNQSKPSSQNQPQKTTELPDVGKLLKEQFYKRLGLSGSVFLFAIGILWWIWTNRTELSTLPVVSSVVKWMGQESIPLADENRFSILVANLVDDQNYENRTLILDELNKFKGIQVLKLDREINFEDAEQQTAEEKGHTKAKNYLSDSHAQVLLWGRILKHEGKTIPKLYWTTSPTTKGERYEISDFHLPEIFWNDLSNVLILLVAQQNQEFLAREGYYFADNLLPFIEKVRALTTSLQSNTERARVLRVFAGSLRNYGEQKGSNEALSESISSYREALKEYTREREPLEWAKTQLGLGVVLTILGARENSTQRLEDAVAVYRDALKELTRERVPLDWAKAQIALGTALARLGERENSTQRLEDAIAAYRDALKERTRERSPIDWATTQNNIGNILEILGERENGTERLEDAVAVYRDALKELTRERVPLDWAKAQIALGTALARLGERENSTQRLEDAIAAYRDALKERTRERSPTDWAMTQDNLGDALRALGERLNSFDQLCESLTAYSQALSVFQKSSGYLAVEARREELRAEGSMRKLFGDKGVQKCRESLSKK